MSLRRADVLVVGLLLVALLGVFSFLLFQRGARPEDAAGDGSVKGVTASRPGSKAPVAPSARPSASGVGDGKVAPVPGAGGGGSSSPSAPGSDTVAKADVWKARPSVEFSTADAALFGHGVTVNLGTYRARVGEDFQVQVALESPALESCTMVLGYDASMLAVVPGSAAPIGRGFRGGIECYADEASGRLVLIHRGVPGSKNIDATKGEGVVVWRMRPLQAGKTDLVVEEGSSFDNGSGQAEAMTILGGGVTIR